MNLALRVKSCSRHRNLRRIPGRAPGFALVIALSLMAFIVLLLIGFSTTVRVDVVLSGLSSDQYRARQNARLGAMVALGDLQKYAGPDQRMTGRGEVMAGALDDPAFAMPNPAADARAYWTGVSRTDGDLNQRRTPDFDNEPGINLHWLISGVNQATASLPVNEDDLVTIYPAGSYQVGTIDANSVEGVADGPEIKAGWVPVLDETNEVVGRYAFFVEDEGVKAKLRTVAPPNSDAHFDGGSLLPGDISVSGLSDWGMISATDQELSRLRYYNDMRLLQGVDEVLLGNRIFDYTINTYGVLSSTRNGGLRKDLSTAFEDSGTFDLLFDGGDAVLVDEDKLAVATELLPVSRGGNGYINWKIFRDYYRLKDAFGPSGEVSASVMKMLGTGARSVEYREGYGGNFSGPLSNGPHGFERYVRSTHYVTHDSGVETYNPLKPILAYFYYEVWADLEYVDAVPPATTQQYKATLYLRPWVAYYNPYNVTLNTSWLTFQPDLNVAVRIRDINGLDLFQGAAGDGGWQFIHLFGHFRDDIDFYSEKDTYSLEPGEVKVMTMNTVASTSQFARILTDDFTNVFAAGFGRTIEETVPPGFDWALVNMEVQTYHGDNVAAGSSDHNEGRPYFLSGRRNRPEGSNPFQPYQWMIFPIAYDMVQTANNSQAYPGKRVFIQDISVNELDPSVNATNSAKFGMWLRTSGESVNQIRPLIDSNMRASLVNPRWDASTSGGLGIRTPASYSAAPAHIGSISSIDSEYNGGNMWGIYDAASGNPTAPGAFPAFSVADDLMKGRWGGSHHDPTKNGRVVLFDVPREPLVSVGQLQHAEAGHYSYEPSYIVGNSYANIRIELDDWRSNVTDSFSDYGSGAFRIPGNFNLYDGSYLVNEMLWDDYIYTTIPYGEANSVYADLLSGDESLRNPRYIPYEPNGFDFDRAHVSDSGEEGVLRNAGLVLVDGSFNINSTSINAWEAFLSSTKGLPLAKLSSDGSLGAPDWSPDGVRFPRMSSSLSGSDEFWDGYAEMDADQVRQLAIAMVEEVRARGPFRTLGEFVNRWNPDDDSIGPDDERRKSGALQAALDRTVNAANLNSTHGSDADSTTYDAIPADSAQAAGFPGHVLQGDILQALSPYMSARSDTFKIISIGQTFDPLTGQVVAEAKCELFVQRLPDPVPNELSALTDDEELANPSSALGRKFRVVDFRWIE